MEKYLQLAELFRSAARSAWYEGRDIWGARFMRRADSYWDRYILS